MNELGSDYVFSKSELIIPKNKKVMAFLSEAIFKKSGNSGFWYLNVENQQNPFKGVMWIIHRCGFFCGIKKTHRKNAITFLFFEVMSSDLEKIII